MHVRVRVTRGSTYAQTTTTQIGAYVNPSQSNGNGSILCGSNADARNFEASLGQKLAVDNCYSGGFFWDNTTLSRAATFDLPNGRTPMLSWSAYNNSGSGWVCIFYTDVVAGVYDSDLAFDVTQLQSLPPGQIMLRLFFTPHSQWEVCAQGKVLPPPDVQYAQYKQAWNYIATYFNNHGVTNVTWVWTGGDDMWTDGTFINWIPAAANILAEDVYNQDAFPKDFPETNICTQAHSFGLTQPLMISETGASASTTQYPNDEIQLEWLNTVKTNCSTLSYFDYWDDWGVQNYVITDTRSFAALAAIGQ